MLKKLLTLSLVAVMLSVTAFAATDIADLSVVYAADTAPVFAYAGGDVDYVTETAKVAESYLAQAKHEDVADLPAWDGKPAEAIVGGKGTAEEPYLISDGAELAYFANAVNAGSTTLCAKLDRDINLGTKNNWSSYSMASYAGTFDGQGHNIYGFYYEVTQSSEKRGLFNSIASGAAIRNFNMIDVEVLVGSSASNGTVSGVVCSSATSSDTAYNAGTAPVISNIFVSGKAGLPSNNKKVTTFGSIAGAVKYADIINCFSAVDVNFTGNKGGLKTYNSGQNASGSSIGVGGIVGVLSHDKNFAKVTNCGNSGDIIAPDNARVGGVIGAVGGNSSKSEIYVNNLYNTGNVSGLRQTAGVIGWVYANINGVMSADNFYNTGDIVANTDENTYVAGVINWVHNNTTQTFYNCGYSTGDVYVKTVDAESGEESIGFNSTSALVANFLGEANPQTSRKYIYRNDLGTATITLTDNKGTADDATDDTTVTRTVPKWAATYATGAATYDAATADSDVTTRYNYAGTAKALAEIKALTADEIATACGSGFVPAFDGGLPILATQKNMLVLDEETYEIAKYTNASSEAVDKTLAIKATEAGYVALNVTAFVEGTSATLEVYTADGTTKIDEKAVSATGIVLLPTGEATEVLVKAAEGSRVLVKQAALPALDGVEATAIKATMDCDVDSATVILALFNGDTLQKVEYLANVASVDGKVTGVIDLTGENVTDCTLRAFLWANGTLAPINAEVAELR